MPKCVERINIKFNANNKMKEEDHLDNFYLDLQAPEVLHDDVACRLFPCALEGHVATWYHILPAKSTNEKYDLFSPN